MVLSAVFRIYNSGIIAYPTGVACRRLLPVTDYANIKPMSRPKSARLAASQNSPEQKVNLRELAEHLGLSVATVSLVMNRSPAAKSIPHHTQARVRAAARELNYRPNVMARMLRQQRSFTIGVIVPEISEGYAALVLSD